MTHDNHPETHDIGGPPLPEHPDDPRSVAWDEWAVESFGRVVYYLDRCRKQYLDENLREHRISGAHVGVLTYLWEGHDGDTQGVIAQRLGVDPATVTRVAQRLERCGYVRRRMSSRDARALHLELTDEGWALAPAVRDVSSAWTDIVTQGVPEEQRGDLLRAMQQMLVRAQGACGE